MTDRRGRSRGYRIGLFALDTVLLLAAVLSVVTLGLGWIVLPPLVIVVTLVGAASFHRRITE